jgi:hypothetical protein
MEAKTEQTEENESPKVTDATLELGSAWRSFTPEQAIRDRAQQPQVCGSIGGVTSK